MLYNCFIVTTNTELFRQYHKDLSKMNVVYYCTTIEQYYNTSKDIAADITFIDIDTIAGYENIQPHTGYLVAFSDKALYNEDTHHKIKNLPNYNGYMPTGKNELLAAAVLGVQGKNCYIYHLT